MNYFLPKENKKEREKFENENLEPGLKKQNLEEQEVLSDVD